MTSELADLHTMLNMYMYVAAANPAAALAWYKYSSV